MDPIQRLAQLRAEAQALQARLADGTATQEDLDRAAPLAEELRQAQAAVTALSQGPSDEERRAAARALLEGVPADPIVDQRGAGNPGTPGDRDPGAGDRTPIHTASRVGDLQSVMHRAGVGFLQSDALRQLQARGFSGQAAYDATELRGSDLAGLHSRVTVDSSGIPQRNPYVATISDVRERPLTLLDMIDRQTTTMNSVPYVQEVTTQAEREGGALEVAEGALKPEAAAPTFEEADAPVRTIAVWHNVTRQMAEDLPSLYGIVTGRLPFKATARLNSQILNGNGTAPNLRGILATTGLNTQAPAAAEARILTVRRAITQCQVDEYAPDTVAMNPLDWEAIELDTDDNGQFRVSPSVAQLAQPRLWGLTVVVSTMFVAGTAVVGDFRVGATLWERQGVRLLVTDSHASNFTSNILTVLAELRAALTVWRPSAFCRVTFNTTVV